MAGGASSGANDQTLGRWTVVQSETLIDTRWLQVRRQRIRTADGVEIPEYYLCDAPDFVALLALTQRHQVILVDQYRHGAAQRVLELPAGMVDPTDSTPQMTAERELLEETGFRAGRIESLGVLFPSTSRQRNRTHCFLALDCEKVAEPGGDPAESITLRLRPLAEVRTAARRGELPSQTSLACLFLGLERLRELGLG